MPPPSVDSLDEPQVFLRHALKLVVVRPYVDSATDRHLNLKEACGNHPKEVLRANLIIGNQVLIWFAPSIVFILDGVRGCTLVDQGYHIMIAKDVGPVIRGSLECLTVVVLRLLLGTGHHQGIRPTGGHLG
jgi:hypothetical protein